MSGMSKLQAVDGRPATPLVITVYWWRRSRAVGAVVGWKEQIAHLNAILSWESRSDILEKELWYSI